MEESFPRGGSVSSGIKRKNEKIKDDTLFKQDRGDEPDSKKNKFVKDQKRGDGNQNRKLVKPFILSEVASEPTIVMYKHLTEDLLVLGRIREIREFELAVSLPNGNAAIVPITNICDAYTKVLRELADSDEGDDENVGTLQELFHEGQVIRGRIMEVSTRENKSPVKLSINPREVNKSLSLQTLRKGMVVTGCVSSKEDHGYVLDLGIPHVSSFIKIADAENYVKAFNNGVPLRVGSYLHCGVTSEEHGALSAGETRVIHVTIDINRINKSVLHTSMGITLNTLLPGMVMECHITKVKDNGLSVKFLDGFHGRIHQSHLVKIPSSYSVGTQIKSAVLHIDPIMKVATLTQLAPFVQISTAVNQPFGDLSVGDIVEGSVLSIDKFLGVVFKVYENICARASHKNLADKKVQNVGKTFQPGNQHKLRVTGFDFADNVLIVSLKESILNQPYMSYKDINIGDIVKCRITKFSSFGVFVSLGPKLGGLIQNVYTADVPLSKPEKKFHLNQELECKVLFVDREQKKLYLTNKKSQMTSKHEAICSYKECVQGLVTEGVIVKILNHGLVLKFFGNVKGYVPAMEMGSQFIEYPEQVFYLGQVVKCFVKYCSPSEEKLIISLKFSEGRDKQSTKTVTAPEGLKIGDQVDCVVKSKTDKVLIVTLKPSNRAAIIPKMHLSDHMSNCPLLMDLYDTGSTIEDVFFYEVSSALVLTKKNIFKDINADHVKTLDDLQPGMEIPGVVDYKTNYGVFVKVAQNLKGLCPNRFLTDTFYEDSNQVYAAGQSVIAKVMEVNKDTNHFLLSLRMLDCYHGDINLGLTLLSSYLEEYQTIIKALSRQEGKHSFTEFYIGQLIEVTVTSTAAQDVWCVHENGAKALVKDENIFGVSCVVGKRISAIVIYIDPVTKTVMLTLKPEIVAARKNYVDNKFSKVEVDESLQSEVVYVHDEFVLVCLEGHALGLFAYLPSKKHPNDVGGKHQFILGQKNPVLIKNIENGHIICSLLSPVVVIKKSENVKTVKKYQIGDTVKATISSIKPDHMDLDIGNIKGQVHISEVIDSPKEGVSVFATFKKGQEITVRIMNLTQKHDKSRKEKTQYGGDSKVLIFADCTMRASKMKKKSVVQEKITKPKVGQSVEAYVISVKGNCLSLCIGPRVKARLYLSNTICKSLEEFHNQYKVGYPCKANVLKKSRKHKFELSMLEKSSQCGVPLRGIIQEVNSKHLMLKLADGSTGIVDRFELGDKLFEHPDVHFKVDQWVSCCIMNKGKHGHHHMLSMRESRFVKDHKPIVDPVITSIDNLEIGKMIRGYVKDCKKGRIAISLGPKVIGKVNQPNWSKYEVKSAAGVFRPGVLLESIVVHISDDAVELSLHPDDTKKADVIPQKLRGKLRPPRMITYNLSRVKRKRNVKEEKKSSDEDSEEETQTKKPKPNFEYLDSGVESDSDKKAVIARPDPKNAPRLGLKAGFSWDATLTLPDMKPVAAVSDSDTDDDDDTNAVPKKRQTKQEREAERKAKEQKLYERERQLMKGETAPETAAEYDRLVLQSPDSSIVWLRYMAFFLESAELERARHIAERALKTICFREEQEKLNVWVAYMNLENLYGTEDTLKIIFERALQLNDPIKVHTQLIQIYVHSDKLKAAEDLHQTLLKKYGSNKDLWINFGLFYYEQGRLDDARVVMQRSLKSLIAKQHVDVIIKFAQLEFKHGEADRGVTLFESVLGNYPKRTDLWSVYIDMVTRQGDLDPARQLYERVISLNMQTKKMRFFFKKFLAFEERYGTPETVAAVKQKALNYVENSNRT